MARKKLEIVEVAKSAAKVKKAKPVAMVTEEAPVEVAEAVTAPVIVELVDETPDPVRMWELEKTSALEQERAAMLY